jgi:N,N'-diacetyllegionaminate synthase
MNMHNVLIIGEAGVNHNGDINIAKKLIDVAVEAGVDMVKFQTFITEEGITGNAEKAEYQLSTTDKKETQFEMLKKLELDREAHEELIRYCNHKGIQFLSTAFDHPSIDLLHELDIPLYKVPSGEIVNLPYLRHIGSMGKPVILSTGMATLKEVEDAINVLEESGTQKDEITVLHCNTSYPTPMQDVNLNGMLTIRDELGVKVGYSDHTLGIEIPIASVAMGARVIEKHFTLDRDMEGPDHKASLDPCELKAMVNAIRNIETALGDGVKRPSSSEIKNKITARKSIVAARNIFKGEIFTKEHLAIKRPGTGISPMKLDKIIGTTAQRDFSVDEAIEV